MYTQTLSALAMGALLAFSCPAEAQDEDVGAIGRIAPRNGIITVVSPASDIVDAVLVNAGDRVARGDTLVLLRTNENTRLTLEAARSALRETREVGTKAVELQRMKVELARTDYTFAQRRYERFKEIGGDSISLQQMEERQYQLETAAQALDIAEKELERLELEDGYRVSRAQREVASAEMALGQAVVRAPIDGTVLDVLKNVGDPAGGAPVARIADLGEMIVVAEVFEGDIKKLEVGMTATVSSSSLSGDINGRVVFISPMIAGDLKIALVDILLDSVGEAARYINMETNVVIHR